MDFYILSAEETKKVLNSSEQGLKQVEAEKRLKKYGFNEIKRSSRTRPIKIFLSQFKNALIILLLLAGFLSLFLHEKLESIAIFMIILLNAGLGFFQEYKAEKDMEALQKLSSPNATVLRDGKKKRIPSRELVPGDIVLIEAGDVVPADCRIISAKNLQADESMLTGESVASQKNIETLKRKTSVSDQKNMVFMGTNITYGSGTVIVTATDMKTEFGKIASSLQDTKEMKTPLQKKFETLAKQIGFVAVSLIIIVLATGYLQKNISFSTLLMFALALTVSTIPNSLPIIVTISLSRGAMRLSKKKMLIKKLPAAESLGAATYICSDKTGTITKNEMTATKMFLNNQIISVTGSGYDPSGNFFFKDKEENPKKFRKILEIASLCNNASLDIKGDIPSILGDPTEGALKVLAKKGTLDDTKLDERFDLIEEFPFDSQRKMMSVVIEDDKGKMQSYVKGAPDILLNRCKHILENGKVRKLTKKDIDKIKSMNHSFASHALRVLGFAYKKVKQNRSRQFKQDDCESDLIFVGLIGMIDPPHDEVKDAVMRCKEAGIKTLIITGDHPLTAKAIAEQIGLFEEGDKILTGEELDKMTVRELKKNIESIRIISRALPIQKLKVVEALQELGHIVAMTGDGVNDSPALKKADIGIAMGISGTDVAKEVAKAVLVDDNYATLVNAIEEGRNIYDKILKSSKYLLSCNAGEITAVFIAVMMNLPLPLLPLQLLIMNLMTDDFPALGLGFEPNEKGIMKRPPRDPREKPITGSVLVSIILFGLTMGLGTFFIFSSYLSEGISKAQTIAFTTLVMFQMFAVLSGRSFRFDIRKANPLTNKWLSLGISISLAIQFAVIYWAPFNQVFGTVPLNLINWLHILSLSALGFLVMELSKLFTFKN